MSTADPGDPPPVTQLPRKSRIPTLAGGDAHVLKFAKLKESDTAARLRDLADSLDEYEAAVVVVFDKDGDARVLLGGCTHIHHAIGALEEAKGILMFDYLAPDLVTESS